MTASPKDCRELTSYFVRKCSEEFHKSPVVNRTTARWYWQDVLEDLTVAQVQETIDYYVCRLRQNDLTAFFRSYDQLYRNIISEHQDKEDIMRLRRETSQRVSKWKERIDQGT